MPIYEYQVKDGHKGCAKCSKPFEVMQALSEPPLQYCPHCGSPLKKLISAPSIGASMSSLDDRAKHAGFHKLKRLGKGEFEKQY